MSVRLWQFCVASCWGVLVFAIVFQAGCGPRRAADVSPPAAASNKTAAPAFPTADADTTTTDAATPADDPSTQDQQEVSLHIAGAEEYAQAIASHRGKVVLVDFWATWCAPCVEQFPHTVELGEKYRPQDLAVVTVSLDDPALSDYKVRGFLFEHQAHFDNLISQHGSAPEALKAFGIAGLPHYRLYDREGELRYHFTSQSEGDAKPIDEVEIRIRELLSR